MQTTCAHMLERTIEHEPSGVSGHSAGPAVYTPGDRVVLTCPLGCEDIIITVVPDTDDEEEDE